MGLFDFARDIGRSVFDTDGEAADKIKEQITIASNPVEGLDVQYDDGTVTLCGSCDSPAHREQVILMAGNMKGVEKVVADELTAPEPPPEEKEKVEYYEIQSGDSLSLIAKRVYGDPMAYKRIYAANRDVIGDDPDKIFPGQKIRIPLD